jgi:hypothetical protein
MNFQRTTHMAIVAVRQPQCGYGFLRLDLLVIVARAFGGAHFLYFCCPSVIQTTELGFSILFRKIS